MQKSRGAILAITLGFIVVFTSFGFTSIYLAGLQNQNTEKQIASTQAFWLAEAGINRAIRNFSGTLNPYPFNSDDDQNLGRGYSAKPDIYGYAVQFLPTGNPDAWIISSSGLVNNQRRTIEVGATRVMQNIDTIIKCNGDLEEQGRVNVIGKKEEFSDVDDDLFYEIFGQRQADLNTSPWTQHIAPYNNPPGVQGIVWIDCPGQQLMITNTNWEGSGILVVNGDLKITGGTFSGIIWVIGNLRIDGNPPINGSVFVEGEVVLNIAGTPNLTYNPDAIEQALTFVPTAPNHAYKLQIMSWQEQA